MDRILRKADKLRKMNDEIERSLAELFTGRNGKIGVEIIIAQGGVRQIDVVPMPKITID